MIPTLFGIMLVSFIIIQFAPGGPMDRIIAQINGTDVGATARISGGGGDGQGPQSNAASSDPAMRGLQGLDPEFIAELRKQFGFDKPAHERFFMMMKNKCIRISFLSKTAVRRRMEFSTRMRFMA